MENTSALCTYCQSPIGEADERTACPTCGAGYHAECWTENGGCGVYGCEQTPPTESRTELEIPVSWWGRESKPCPSCGHEILAAALRCRHCGATFASARPTVKEEFNRGLELTQRHPVLRRNVVIQFVLSALPITAPVGAVMGLVWYLPNRHDVASLPGLHSALARIALVVGIGQTLAVVLASVAFALKG